MDLRLGSWGDLTKVPEDESPAKILKKKLQVSVRAISFANDVKGISRMSRG